jgi:hypothetical protein
VVGLTLAGKIRLAYWILASAVGILVAARIRIPFRTISNPAPRTDKAVSFHAVCVVDVNADKTSHLTDGNLVHSDPVVIIQNFFLIPNSAWLQLTTSHFPNDIRNLNCITLCALHQATDFYSASSCVLRNELMT